MGLVKTLENHQGPGEKNSEGKNSGERNSGEIDSRVDGQSRAILSSLSQTMTSAAKTDAAQADIGIADIGIAALVQLTKTAMAAVNDTILARTGSDVTMIPDVDNHLISSGGKRLRPMLTLACAGLCGYQGEGHIKLAASVEFMHTATLLHDDVVDDSTLRRGKLAARMIWGNEASVLVGDFLLGQAFRMMVEVGQLQCLDVLSHAAAVIAEGEVMQLSTAKHLSIQEEDYLAVITAKTAALFAAACEVGAILAERSQEDILACRAYGANLGIAFQLVDDALDYGGLSRAPEADAAKTLGKNIADDFREGKITLPVLLAYAKGNSEERAFWQRTVEEGRIEEGDLAHARLLLHQHEAVLSTIARAKHYGQLANEALHQFPASAWRTALEEAVAFAIARVN